MLLVSGVSVFYLTNQTCLCSIFFRSAKMHKINNLVNRDEHIWLFSQVAAALQLYFTTSIAIPVYLKYRYISGEHRSCRENSMMMTMKTILRLWAVCYYSKRKNLYSHNTSKQYCVDSINFGSRDDAFTLQVVVAMVTPFVVFCCWVADKSKNTFIKHTWTCKNWYRADL